VTIVCFFVFLQATIVDYETLTTKTNRRIIITKFTRHNRRLIAIALLAILFNFVVVKSGHIIFESQLRGVTTEHTGAPAKSSVGGDDCVVCQFVLSSAVAPGESAPAVSILVLFIAPAAVVSRRCQGSINLKTPRAPPRL